MSKKSAGSCNRSWARFKVHNTIEENFAGRLVRRLGGASSLIDAATGETLPGRDLSRLIASFAAGFQSAGLRPGDRFALGLQSQPGEYSGIPRRHVRRGGSSAGGGTPAGILWKPVAVQVAGQSRVDGESNHLRLVERESCLPLGGELRSLPSGFPPAKSLRRK